MWKEYSSGYLKKNRASSISVMTAAFISALLLSLLCSIFYNLWVYEIERIKTEEGDWQGRIVGEISEQDLFGPHPESCQCGSGSDQRRSVSGTGNGGRSYLYK